MIAKGEMVRNYQWQGSTFLQSGGFISLDLGKRKGLYLYNTH